MGLDFGIVIQVLILIMRLSDKNMLVVVTELTSSLGQKMISKILSLRVGEKFHD